MVKKNQSKHTSNFNPNSVATFSDSKNAATPPGNLASLVANGNYEAAIVAMGKSPGDEVASNFLGVCLLRAGRPQEAIVIFRRLVLNPGSTLVREHVNPLFVRNYAAALVMSGLPGVVKGMLSGLPEPNHPAARQIQAAIRNWAKTLPFFRRWDWRISGITPTNCQIPLDFEPGEFYFPTQSPAEKQAAVTTAPGKLAV